MASALFTVDGSSTQTEKVVAFGATVNYALVNTAGVNSVEYVIFGGDGTYVATAPTLAGAVGNASHVMPTDPGHDIAFGVECLVNGGLDASGRPDPNLRCRRVIGTTVYGADIPLVAGETTERDSLSGWVGPLNRDRLTGRRLIAIRTITSGTIYTPTAGTTAILVECLGGGGAGGSCATGATNSAAAGGGQAGYYSASWLTGAAVKATFSIAIGAGGTPAAAGSGSGGNGGNTTFDSPSVCTAVGGQGGEGHTVEAPPCIGGRGLDRGTSGVGNLMTIPGAIGGHGMCLSASEATAGAGAPAAFGGGAASRFSQGNGYSANQNGDRGSGGSGGCILSGGASVSGGAGAPGLIRVWEFG